MSASASGGAVLQFEQLQSAVSPAFWAALSAAKLDEYKLSEDPKEIYGFLSPSSHEGVPAALHLNEHSLPPAISPSEATGTAWPPRPPAGAAAVPGTLLLVNTRERFAALDRKALLSEEAERIFRAALRAGGGGGQGEGDDEDVTPELSRFLVVAHADLKAYRYTYWFAFPALKPPSPFLSLRRSGEGGGAASASPLAVALGGGSEAASAVASACDAFLRKERSSSQQRGPPLAWTVRLRQNDENASFDAECFPLRRLLSSLRRRRSSEKKNNEQEQEQEQLLLAFADPGADPSHPGWTLRNVLFAAAAAASGTSTAATTPPLPLRCVCARTRRGVADPTACLSLDVDLSSARVTASGSGPSSSPVVPTATGWERSARKDGRPGPRVVDLSSSLDPARLASDALALNLRLMRWRAAPDLDPATVSGSRFVLFGAGTLGCGVARTLLGWGATGITLVDSGVVSFSNPPRQSLFEHADCFGYSGSDGGGRSGSGGGKPKAEAAAEALWRIYPGCRGAARGIRISIPMPGHPYLSEDGAAKEEGEGDGGPLSRVVSELDALVASHDVSLLLTDTREARWLPALLCAAHGKLCITAALGFDSYVVMRHGGPPPRDSEEKDDDGRRRHRRRLGCFFCSDVVAPRDSTSDRTLDQQCTVSRPGCAPLAAAIAVELAAAVLAHPLGVEAPPPRDPDEQGRDGPPPAFSDLPLGEPAHMVRGRLGAAFSQRAMTSEAFARCTACSAAVVASYRERGWRLVEDALGDPRSLEALTGLDEVHARAAAMVVEGEEEAVGGGEGDEEEEDWTEL